MEPGRHPFSWQGLARIITAGLVVFLIWKSIGVFVVVLIALVIAAALYPVAKKMNKKMNPSGLCLNPNANSIVKKRPISDYRIQTIPLHYFHRNRNQ